MMAIFVKFYRLLVSKEKFQFVILFFLMLFGALLETIGVAIIPFFIKALNTPEIISNGFIGKYTSKIFTNITLRDTLLFFTIVITVLYWVKNLFLSATYILQVFLLKKSEKDFL